VYTDNSAQYLLFLSDFLRDGGIEVNYDKPIIEGVDADRSPFKG
jgi:hypothetical protein